MGGKRFSSPVPLNGGGGAARMRRDGGGARPQARRSDSVTLNQRIDRAAAALRDGALVIMPTETVYGLAADAGNAAAVAALYDAKGRPAFNPLIAHVLDLGAARHVANLDARAERLGAAFWPGPLTIVAPARADGGVCDLARAGLDTVAVRVPAHPTARALLEAFGGPIVAPSANRSGRPSPTNFADAMAETGAAAAAALDGGDCAAWTRIDGHRAAGRSAAPAASRRRDPRPDRGAHRPARRGGVGCATLARPPRPPLCALRAGAPERHGAPSGRSLSGLRSLASGTRRLQPQRVAGTWPRPRRGCFRVCARPTPWRPAAIAVAPIPEEGLGEAINDRLRRAAGHVG